ncbi:serine/threonine-protein kinase [Actinomadura sp. WAC 06369]|uniref:serine/threonine-protein kinase n=1 Tax=Actinomadura sp. WAC 06369 TaxID=2203193 RepID=UPI0018F28299|nr:serine/threonine-protein kinase [Actinomadura sp. WAC 06369]
MQALEPGDPRSVETSGRVYRLVARLGSGGMGTVYLGRSAAGRAVAVKIVHPEFAADARFRERFRREAELSGTVGGGFTAPVVDAAPDARPPWLATEFVPSVPLRDAVRSGGALPPDAVRRLAAGVAEALVEIHGAGVVHRDLTPANVLLAADGPRVIDFGIARALDAATITSAGTPLGAPGFMSPEQAAGEPIGPPSDVFTFGATLLYAATGREPFGAGTWHEQLLRLRSERPRLDRVADADLRALIADCMEREPSRRPTAARLAERLAAGTSPGAAPGPAPGAAVWPPGIAAEIERRRAAAERPAVPGGGRGRPARAGVAVAAVAAALAVVAAVSAAVWFQGRGGGPEPAAAPAPPSAAVPATSAPPAPVGEIRFLVSGDGEVESLTYSVNGDSRTVENVELPWEVSVPIPASVPRTVWELDVTNGGSGVIRYKVDANGRLVTQGATAGQGTGHAEGSI